MPLKLIGSASGWLRSAWRNSGTAWAARWRSASGCSSASASWLRPASLSQAPRAAVATLRNAGWSNCAATASASSRYVAASSSRPEWVRKRPRHTASRAPRQHRLKHLPCGLALLPLNWTSRWQKASSTTVLKPAQVDRCDGAMADAPAPTKATNGDEPRLEPQFCCIHDGPLQTTLSSSSGRPSSTRGQPKADRSSVR